MKKRQASVSFSGDCEGRRGQACERTGREALPESIFSPSPSHQFSWEGDRRNQNSHRTSMRACVRFSHHDLLLLSASVDWRLRAFCEKAKSRLGGLYNCLLSDCLSLERE